MEKTGDRLFGIETMRGREGKRIYPVQLAIRRIENKLLHGVGDRGIDRLAQSFEGPGFIHARMIHCLECKRQRFCRNIVRANGGEVKLSVRLKKGVTVARAIARRFTNYSGR